MVHRHVYADVALRVFGLGTPAGRSRGCQVIYPTRCVARPPCISQRPWREPVSKNEVFSDHTVGLPEVRDFYKKKNEFAIPRLPGKKKSKNCHPEASGTGARCVPGMTPGNSSMTAPTPPTPSRSFTSPPLPLPLPTTPQDPPTLPTWGQDVRDAYGRQAEQQVVDSFSDSDWRGCAKTRRSTSFSHAMLGGHLFAASATTQNVVATSSGEAEFHALTKSASRALGAVATAADLAKVVKPRARVDATASKAIAS